MTLNINCSQTLSEILNACHKSTVVPTIAILLISTAILFPIIIGSIFGFSKINWGKLFLAELLLLLFLGGISTFIILSPNIIQSISELFLK